MKKHWFWSWKGLLALAMAIAAAVGGPLLLERQIETTVREEIQRAFEEDKGTATVSRVRYSLVDNILTLNECVFTFPDGEVAEAAFGEIHVSGIDRISLIRSCLFREHENIPFTGTVNGARVRMLGGNGEKLMTADSFLADQLVISKQAVETLERAEKDDDAFSFDTVRALFLGEKPLVKKMELRGLSFGSGEAELKMDALYWSNPVNNPFTFDCGVEGMRLPVTDYPELGYLGMLGYRELALNLSLGGVVPAQDGKTPAVLRVKGRAAEMGEVQGAGEFLFEPALRLEDFFQEDIPCERIKLASLRASYTEGGILGRIVRFSRSMLGIDAAQFASKLSGTAWRLLPVSKRTPQTKAMLDKLGVFLERPGTLSVSIMPPSPLFLDELEKNYPLYLKMEVTPGEKTLEEQSRR